VQTRLRTIAAAALPMAALATAAVSFDARADMAAQAAVPVTATVEPLSTFVGQPAYDENGTLLGTIHEVVVDQAAPDAPATAIITREDGQTLALPLGPSQVVAALVNAREMLVIAEEVTPVIVGPVFSPESRGS
jgi:hypothetical protein